MNDKDDDFKQLAVGWLTMKKNTCYDWLIISMSQKVTSYYTVTLNIDCFSPTLLVHTRLLTLLPHRNLASFPISNGVLLITETATAVGTSVSGF